MHIGTSPSPQLTRPTATTRESRWKAFAIFSRSLPRLMPPPLLIIWRGTVLTWASDRKEKDDLSERVSPPSNEKVETTRSSQLKGKERHPKEWYHINVVRDFLLSLSLQHDISQVPLMDFSLCRSLCYVFLQNQSLHETVCSARADNGWHLLCACL